MASTSFMPSLSEMAEIRSNGLGVPIFFLVGEDGLDTVTTLHISIRFGLQDTSLWIKMGFMTLIPLPFHTSCLRCPSTPMMAQSFGPSSLAGIGCMV